MKERTSRYAKRRSETPVRNRSATSPDRPLLNWVIIATAIVACSTDALAARKTEKLLATNVPPGKPEIFSLEPRGLQSGSTNRIKLIGTNLLDLTELNLSHPKLSGQILDEPEATTNVAWIELTVPADLARGPYELSVKNTNAEGSK